MGADTDRSDAGPWTPSRRWRIGVGLLAGVGATGIAASLGLIGTFLDVDLPVFDPSALILMAPLIVLPGFAGAVLRGRDAVAAIMAGAMAGPIVAIFAIDGSCERNMWAALGLAAIAALALAIAGVAAFVGALLGGAGTAASQPRRGVTWLVVFGSVGVVGWIAALALLGRCP